MKHIIQSPAVDYLTLTAYGTEDQNTLSEIWHGTSDGTDEQAKVMQYAGVRSFGQFIGFAEVSGHWHCMATSSGAHAQSVADRARLRQMEVARCTRIDIQVTVPAPSDPAFLQDIRDICRDKLHPFNTRGRRPLIDMIDKDDGLSTLYVGSRTTTNRALIRMYIKEISGARYLRFECEFGGKRADHVWTAYKRDADALGRFVMGEYDKLPKAAKTRLQAVREAANADAQRAQVIQEADDCWKTLDWFIRAVEPALERLSGTPARAALQERIGRINSQLIRAQFLDDRTSLLQTMDNDDILMAGGVIDVINKRKAQGVKDAAIQMEYDGG